MNKEQIKDHLSKDIKENTIRYPFISRFWDIELIKPEENNKENIAFGHYGSVAVYSDPFYKPISKIVDTSKFV